jgi:hypothetical protein
MDQDTRPTTHWDAFVQGCASVFDFALLAGLSDEEFGEEPPVLAQSLADIRQSSERAVRELDRLLRG